MKTYRSLVESVVAGEGVAKTAIITGCLLTESLPYKMGHLKDAVIYQAG